MFGEKILDYWDDIMKDLGDIIAIPSVAQPQDGPYPFGKDAATAVDKAIEIAERYGIKTKNSDYYAMHAELGEGEENAVVMAHLDVVPAGEGWDSDPYTMVIRDGKAFGRGVSDNKGPAIVALHCLRALKEAGVVGKRKLRVVLGSAEEIGMQDMGHYFSKEQMPTMGFTPDACYGVCHCEKGLFRFAVTGKVGKKIVSFKAGTVVNAVPYKAEADVLCDDDEFAKLVEAATAAEVKFDITRTESGAHIVATGKAAHASTPEIGINAAAHLAHLLVNVFGADCGEFLTFMDEKVGLAYDGSNIGVKMSDEPSGALTFNLGLVNIENGEGRFDIDIRYPATKSGAEIDKILAGNSAYIQSKIPANTYTGQDKETKTFGVKCLIIVSADMDEGLVYDLCKAMNEHTAEMAAGNALLGEMTDPSFLCTNMPIPLHDGAAKYYGEQGLL